MQVSAEVRAGRDLWEARAAVDGPVNDRINDAYRAKYGDSPYLPSLFEEKAREATLKVMPREPQTTGKSN